MIKSTDNLNVHVSPFYFVAQCVNRPSNYSCECDSGFEGDGTLGCTGKLSIGLNLLSKLLPFIFYFSDIDECLSESLYTCPTNAQVWKWTIPTCIGIHSVE